MKIESLAIEKLRKAVEKTNNPNMIRLFNRLNNTGITHPDLEKLISSGAEENLDEQKSYI